MFKAALAQLRTHPSRVFAVCLAIVLGVGFAAGTVVFTDTYRAGLAATVSATSSKLDVVVEHPAGDESPRDTASAVRDLPGVADAEPLFGAGVQFSTERTRGYLSIDVVPQSDRLRWFTLDSGRWPAGAAEIVVDTDTVTGSRLPIGSVVSLSTNVDDERVDATVVGVVDTSASAMAGAQPWAFAAPALFTALQSDGYAPVAVLGDGSVSPDALRVSIIQTIGADAGVLTGADKVAMELESIDARTEVLTTVLLAFAAIALVVAAIVIANTFTILLTQRRRQIALLRCVGASGPQVRRQVLAEAVLIGLLGSVIGVALGMVLGSVGAAIAGLDAAGPVFSALPLIGIAAVGTVITVLAAWLPASSAMRVSPLAALRPVQDAARHRRVGRRRVALASVLTIGGGAIMAGGVVMPSLMIAMGGGVVAAVGILLLTPTFLPPLLRLLGGAGRLAGTPGKLAGLNAIRNTGRAAATCAALLIGVTLIVTLQVAVASAGRSLDSGIADRYPVDVAVGIGGFGPSAPGSTPDSLPAGLADEVAAIDGIAGSSTMSSADVQVVGQDQSMLGGGSVQLIGVSESAAALVRGGTDELNDDTLLVPGWAIGPGVEPGDTVTLTAGGQQREFTIAAGRLPDAGLTGSTVVTTDAALRELVPQPTPVAVWATVADGADLSAVNGALTDLTADHPELSVGGGAGERASVADALGTIITLATALLAVAVVIAIVGIGNTLGLSVIERTQESALLRALGLRRGQLRLMLAVEALLLAAVGAVAGIGLGVLFGWSGAAATLAEAERTLVFAIPWSQLAIVFGVALVAGLLASVLPARRAANTPPTAALADLG